MASRTIADLPCALGARVHSLDPLGTQTARRHGHLTRRRPDVLQAVWNLPRQPSHWSSRQQRHAMTRGTAPVQKNRAPERSVRQKKLPGSGTLGAKRTKTEPARAEPRDGLHGPPLESTRTRPRDREAVELVKGGHPARPFMGCAVENLEPSPRAGNGREAVLSRRGPRPHSTS
jgi:hypothetical protein